MEYPGTKFTRRWRVGLLLFCILLFLILAPVVILTTAGYRFSWKNNFLTFRGTGSISVDILPRDATVYLNGIRLSGGMPYRLNALTPENIYTLKIESPEYFDWQKDIVVSGGETYYLKDISMLKKKPREFLLAGEIKQLSISPDYKKLVYTKPENNKLNFYLFDVTRNSSLFLTSFSLNDRLTINWHERSNLAIVSFGGTNTTNFYLLDADQGAVTDLDDILGAIPTNALWDNRSNADMYLSTTDTLFVYRPANASLTSVGKLKTARWFVENGRVTTLNFVTNTKHYTVTKDTFGFASTITIDETRDFNIVSDDAVRFDLAGTVGQTIILKRADGTGLKLITNNKIFSVPASNFLVSRYNNWLIMWSPFEIWTYSDGAEPMLLNRSGEHLKKVIPLDEFNTLALAWQSATTVLYPYYLISHELLPGVNDLASNPRDHIIYFSATLKNQIGLWSLSY